MRSRGDFLRDQNRKWRSHPREQSGASDFLRPSGVSREAIRKGEQKQFKLKLCTLFQRGHCVRQRCPFAHGEEELRRFAAPENNGRYSPCRRCSPTGDGGSCQLSGGQNGRSRGRADSISRAPTARRTATRAAMPVQRRWPSSMQMRKSPQPHTRPSQLWWSPPPQFILPALEKLPHSQ